MRRRACILHSAFCIAIATLSGCMPTASTPVATTPTPPVTTVTWEQKLGWIVRLEDQRLLRDPNPPPPVVLRPATRTEPVVYAPAPPSDLIRLLGDSESRVRHRAALAIGRVHLVEGVAPLADRLANDEQPEVREMAAFALGLIADASARPALLRALTDPLPLIQGRAAQALSLIGDKSDAAAIGSMVQAHVKAGALMGIAPDDLTYPLAPPVEAIRLGLYALTRLGSYDAIAADVLADSGQPVSRWWPIAFALQRVNDPRATPALMALLDTPGRFTASFAARGLAAQKAPAARTRFRELVEQRKAPTAVLVQAIRGLVNLAETSMAEPLLALADDSTADPELRQEALDGFTALATRQSTDLMLDMMTDPAPQVRAAARRALARVDPDTLMTALSSTDPDRDWTVRVAQAAALGKLSADRSAPLLRAMLGDQDQRVVPAVIDAIVAAKVADAEALVLRELKADDFVVRAHAAAALADLKATTAAQALIDAYRASLGDSTYVARAAILDALNIVSPPSARPLLQEALQDRDWPVRSRALALLKAAGVTDVGPASIRPAPAAMSTPAGDVDSPEWQAIVNPKYSPHAFIETDKGTIEIELAIADAPLTVNSFVLLARKGFFDGVAIHRVVPDFVVQDGDPRGDGEGGPGYAIRDEVNERPYLRGTVGMALDWEDTGGSQFFITHSPQPHLDARYTVFGYVVNGMDVVDRIVPSDVIRSVKIWDGVTASR
ncbi:MAG TPA: peptidylprolyl isomerase [Vicinamibacterales bacterium]|jgi:cyclophilin family peptidyl-prolyl cis-trans isomerase/HEAT repeat protein|nr:peptidylprolyl isomerase [Vicinamibacterales bacterium]